jgi:prepilin-type processing-associated H-X9-DG protein
MNKAKRVLRKILGPGAKDQQRSAFTLAELLVLVTVLALGCLVLAPAVARTKPNSKALHCQNNLRRVMAAWTMYASDYSDRLANNFTIAQVQNEISGGTYRNWANDVMSWTTDQMNTNVDSLRKGVMSPYLSGNCDVYKCPADEYLSPVQQAMGFAFRVRSISMNGLLGGAQGLSIFPQYSHYLKLGQIRKPAHTWVILDEHPDSINEGFFINDPLGNSWGDIPASYHNGGCGFGFADGHSEIKKWRSATSQIPVKYAYVTVPFDQTGKLSDFAWYLQRAGYSSSANGQPLFGY